MPGLPLARPDTIGFDPAGLQRAFDLLAHWSKEGKVLSAGLCVGRRGRMVEPRFFGKQRTTADSPPLRSDALFLVASLTKPVTVLAVLMLVERGELALDDPVSAILPAFTGKGREGVRIRHLMTHTSGLPDMVADNEKLRKAHKPLSAFVEATCKEELLFPPGTRVSYQSMGTLLLGEVVHQVTGRTLPEFLRKEVFDPLGMVDASLGWQVAKKERIAEVFLAPGQRGLDWNWNSPYWLGLGVPWGGMITSPADHARFCQMMLEGGSLDGVRILSPAGVRAMTSNQLNHLPVPEEERRLRPWGLGWRLNWPGHSANFGDLLGPRSYGHWGSTGTLCWVDPDTEAFCVLLTTQPQEPEGRYLARISNVVAAALV
jgi:CubicO group peptidase (beta-lactamase class C family)